MLQISLSPVYYQPMSTGGYKAVMFDLDGTLVDTMGDIAASANKALEALGLDALPMEEYRSRVGWGLRRTLELSLPSDMKGRLDEAAELLLSYYRNHPAEYTVPYKGIPELLEVLRSDGIRLFVYTNKDQETARKVTGILFPDDTFEDVIGARPGIPLKPDAGAAALAVVRSGFKPEEILYVGDSEVDMETAAAGKMDALGVLWGYRNREQLEGFGALAFVEHPDEIRDRIQ